MKDARKFIINIEGIDGTGKYTVSSRLKEIFTEKGKTVFMMNFPNYESETGKLIKRFLTGELLGDPVKTDPVTASLLYTVDRRYNYELYKDEINNCDIIINNRSYMSNFFFQASKYALNEQGMVNMRLLMDEYQTIFDYINIMTKLEITDTFLKNHKDDISNILLYHPNTDINFKLIDKRNETKDLYETNHRYLEGVSAFSILFDEYYGDELLLNYPEYAYDTIACSDYDGNELFMIDEICYAIIEHLSIKRYIDL